jgi:hypothetical protein
VLTIVLPPLAAWLSGLAAFYGGYGLLYGVFPRGFYSLIAVLSLIAAAITSGVLYAPVMYRVRERTSLQTLPRSAAIGAALGLVPGAMLAWVAGAIDNIDRSPVSVVQLLLLTPALLGLFAGVMSGLAFGVVFHLTIDRR